MPNITSVTLTAGVPTAGTGTVGTLDNVTGTAGSPSVPVLTVQGVASGTNIPVLISTGTNIIGSVKTTDGTNTAAVKAASIPPIATDPALVVAISPNSVNANGQATMANSAPVAIASNQSAIPVNLAALSTGGATLAKAFSAASTNATSLKASAGTLYGLVAINTTATVYYLKLYDKASAPTVGTDVPVQTYPIAASTSGAGEVIPFPVGGAFSNGIAWALTAAAADADTGVAATGVTINFQYK